MSKLISRSLDVSCWSLRTHFRSGLHLSQPVTGTFRSLTHDVLFAQARSMRDRQSRIQTRYSVHWSLLETCKTARLPDSSRCIESVTRRGQASEKIALWCDVISGLLLQIGPSQDARWGKEVCIGTQRKSSTMLDAYLHNILRNSLHLNKACRRTGDVLAGWTFIWDPVHQSLIVTL